MNENKLKHDKAKKKWSKKKKVITAIVSVVSLIVIIGLTAFTYSYYLYSKMDNFDLDRDSVLNDSGKNSKYKHITNIALFGTDTTEGIEGLSDSIMILTINNETKEVKLSSIMRDSYVSIPGHGENIINMAMMDGGPELSLKTINTNFDLDIDKFIAVNLNTLPKIIDKVGGVEISIDSEELQIINNHIANIDKLNGTTTQKVTKTGKQLLNGTQATAFCRIRYTSGTDFKRTERQREVFTQIFKKLSNLGIMELNSFVDDILPIVTTNLTYGEVVSIGTGILGLGSVEIQQNRFPNDGDHWSSGNFGDYKLHIDKEATTEKMHKFIYSE